MKTRLFLFSLLLGLLFQSGFNNPVFATGNTEDCTFDKELAARVLNAKEGWIEVNLNAFDDWHTRVLMYHAIYSDQALCANHLSQPGLLRVEYCGSDKQINALHQQLAIIVSEAYKLTPEYDKVMIANILEVYDTDNNGKLLNFLTGADRGTNNAMCADSAPFCTSDIYTFPAGVNSGTAENGPYYGCLTTRPNPAWFHMKIAVGGYLQIYMFSTPLRDIDFIMWGPYDDPVTPCPTQLTANKVIDCSYSPAPTEYCDIANAQVGKYYILLITNYSNQPCNITFQKSAGTGETDCTILPPLTSSNSPLCVGQTLELYAETINNASYYWSGPNNFISTQQNPTIQNVQLSHAGMYSCVITVNNSSSDPSTANVVVNPTPTPNFSFNPTCFGDTTFFVDESTVNPPQAQITLWEWNFGDGTTAYGQHQEKVFGNPGTYLVSMTTYTGFMQCPRTKNKAVVVSQAASANAGPDEEIPNGWTVQLQGEVAGGSGNYSIQWEPANLLDDPTILTPTTVPMGATTVFTMHVTDNTTSCQNSDQTTVIVTGGVLGVTAEASPSVICLGQTVQLNALPSGGSGGYTYTWTSNHGDFNSTEKEPVVNPIQTTIYQVAVSDGFNSTSATVTVTVKPMPAASAGADQTINIGTSTQLSGYATGGSGGNYSYRWTPADSLINATVQNPTTKILNATTEFTLIIDDMNGCSSQPDQVLVLVAGDVLAVYPQATPSEICLGASTTINANATGGGGSYTYSWTANNSGWTSNSPNPTVSPAQTTVYTISVNDTYKIVTGQVTVVVNPLPLVDIKPANIPYFSNDTIKVCVRDSVWLDAGNPGFSYLWWNQTSHNRLRASTNGNWIDFQTHWVRVTNPVTGCVSHDTLTIFFDFNACNIGVPEKEFTDHYINVHPNPSNGLFRVDFKELNDAVVMRVVNIHGQTVLNDISFDPVKEGKSFVLDLSGKPDATYILTIQSSRGIMMKRLIKK